MHKHGPLLALVVNLMAPVRSGIEFLAQLPLYEEEKPYLYLPGKDEGLDPNVMRLDNLEYELHPDILIKDMRQHPELNLDECGFEFYEHRSRFQDFLSPEDIDGYRDETEQLLRKRFSAVRVLTYEVRLRKNQDFRRTEFDVYDKMLVEGRAKGAHNGAHVSDTVETMLTSLRRDLYFRPGNHSKVPPRG